MTSEELTAYMQRHSLTDARLAELLGVTRQSVHGWRTGRTINRITELALERLETIMTTATVETIEDSLTSYADSSTHVQGFVSWAWDMREQTLEQLRERADVDIASELEYHAEEVAVANDQPKLRDAGKAAALYLAEHRDDLIAALEESLADD